MPARININNGAQTAPAWNPKLASSMWNVVTKSVLARQQGLKTATVFAERLDSDVTWTHGERQSQAVLDRSCHADT